MFISLTEDKSCKMIVIFSFELHDRLELKGFIITRIFHVKISIILQLGNELCGYALLSHETKPCPGKDNSEKHR